MTKVTSTNEMSKSEILEFQKRRPFAKSFDPKKGLTKQADAETVDINKIVARYVKNGEELPQQPLQQFSDLPLPDFQDMQNIVAAIRSDFEDLPADMRDEFQNNPDNYLSFVQAYATEIELNGLRDAFDSAVRIADAEGSPGTGDGQPAPLGAENEPPTSNEGSE